MSELESGLPEDVAGDEMLARFVMSSSHYNARGVKSAAFLPDPKHGETSVFRYTEKAGEVVRTEGKSIATSRGLRLHGISLVSAQAVFDVRLMVAAQEPPPRHANIVGWPQVSSDLALQKAAQKKCAMLLARAAYFEHF